MLASTTLQKLKVLITIYTNKFTNRKYPITVFIGWQGEEVVSVGGSFYVEFVHSCVDVGFLGEL